MAGRDDEHDPNPYAPPAEDRPPVPETPWGPLAKGLVGWIAVLGPIAGFSTALVTHGNLRRFGAEQRVAGVVAVQALRGIGPTVACLGASFAIVWAARRAQHDLPSRGVPIVFSLAVALTPLAGALACAAGMVTAVALGTETPAAWRFIGQMVVPRDLLDGLVIAACYALACGALALVSLRFLRHARARFVVVLLGMLIATRVTIALTQFVVEATLFPAAGDAWNRP
jgi:ABC-type transporter Mla maintaining outer membrane lipid asymmetry permease subunit MlaE